MSNKQPTPHTHIRPRLRILFLHTRFPYPLIGGDRIKAYHILKHLAAYHDVTLLTFHHRGTAPLEKYQALEELGINVVAIPLNPLKAGVRCITHALNDLPLEIMFYNHPEYRRELDKLMAEKNFDLAMGFFMRAGEYLRHLPLKKILIAEDCRVLYEHRSLMATRMKNVHQKFVRWWELKKLLKYEPSMFNDFDVTTFVTMEDINAAKTLNPHVQYRLLTNGVVADPVAQYVPQSERRDIIFTGKLDVWANTMMIQTIAKEILPRIHQRMPDVKFHIVGGYPPKSVLKLQSDKILVHGNVPDVRKYMRNAAVFVHPHSAASGIQNKVLEAMATGCAIVTTTTGIQGIPAWHDREVLIAHNYEEMANYAAMLLEDVEHRTRLADRAMKLVTEKFSWETINAQMDGIIDELIPPKALVTQGYGVEGEEDLSVNKLTQTILSEELPLSSQGRYKPTNKR